jgi:hypothetical protein
MWWSLGNGYGAIGISYVKPPRRLDDKLDVVEEEFASGWNVEHVLLSRGDTFGLSDLGGSGSRKSSISSSNFFSGIAADLRARWARFLSIPASASVGRSLGFFVTR